MEELFQTASGTNESSAGGRILIVDDDPLVSGMLGVSLGVAGHEIMEAGSGEQALAQLLDSPGDALPDVVFLDIEMGLGIDGYETCRRLRAVEATRDLPVIFLSSHDALDDRLRAYDAGGSDFMAKPFVPEEVLRKADLAIRHARRQKKGSVENRYSFDTAMTALSSLGESGVTLKFNRGALGCRTLHALATLIIESMGSFGLACHVQLRTPTENLTLTPQGPASPLEESVIDQSRLMDRIFSFHNRLIINYDSVSLLVTNMPLDDEDLCGRIRDHAAMIAEGADLAAGNINLRNEAVQRADELHRLADVTRQAVEELQGNYRHLQLTTRFELENMTSTIEGLFSHLGLTNNQEFVISDTMRSAVERVLTLFTRSNELDQSFAGIVEELTRAGTYTVAQDDEPPPTIELW